MLIFLCIFLEREDQESSFFILTEGVCKLPNVTCASKIAGKLALTMFILLYYNNLVKLLLMIIPLKFMKH